MPKISEMMDKGKYLKTEDLRNLGGEADGTIVGVKLMDVAMQGQPKDERWVMKFREHEQLFVLNNVNLQLIAKALGSEDTGDWKGQVISLYVDESVQFQSKLVGGIRVRVPAAKPRAGKAPVERVRQDAVVEGEEVAAEDHNKKHSHFDDFEDDIPF